jgi:hypothetical protein
MKRALPLIIIGLGLSAGGRAAQAFPFTWDPYLRYLNTQVTEVNVPDGTTYWRVYSGDAVPPPDTGFGDIKIWYRTVDENGSALNGIPVRVFNTSSGSTLGGASTPGEFIMGGGNWSDFYNQLGPYSIEISPATGQPSEACMGLGLPANQHFSYTIVFQRAVKGVTPTAPQPTPLGKPDGTNLLVNPGAETGNLSGWSHSGMGINGDIFNNCGNRAGSYRFSWQTYGPGSAHMSQTVNVTAGNEYTFGFWVAKKSTYPYATLTASWSDNGGGSGVLYSMPESETIFPIYGTRQDATITPLGNQLTVTVSMSYTTGEFAAFHLDEFWLVEVTPAGPPVIQIAPQSFSREVYGGKTLTDDTFTLENTGESVLEFSITDDADWLEAFPATGTTASETDTITLSYTPDGLEAGTYAATVMVADPDASNSPQAVDVTLTVLVPGDFDGDRDVDLEDFGRFQVCYTGSGGVQDEPACQPARIDSDPDVDGDDFSLFQACFTSANVPGTVACLAEQP